MNRERILELSLLPLEKWEENEIRKVIQSQYNVAWKNLQENRSLWRDYLKLYVNHYRKLGDPDSLGSKILFTKFNEMYSELSIDDINIEFETNSIKDKDKVAVLNKVAKYDWDKFKGTKVMNMWLWDSLFFKYGILDISQFDRSRLLINVKTQDPFLFLFDPVASSRQDARFMGRFIYATYYDLLNNSKLDPEEVKNAVKNYFLSPEKKKQQTDFQEYQQAKQILLGTNFGYEEEINPFSLFEIVEWYMRVGKDLYVVWVSNDFNYLLGFEKADYRDGIDGISQFPFAFKNFYQIPRNILGLGIPDIIEDDHRADVRLINSMYQGILQDATPSFFYDVDSIISPKTLLTREIGKNVPVRGNPLNVMQPFPKSQVVSNDTIAFLNLIENRADLAIGSSKILRGALTSVKKSATEVAIAKSKQDRITSARLKDMIEADKEFWYAWLQRYRRYMGENDKKFIRILDPWGQKEMEELAKNQFVPDIDPDIIITSSLISEPEKILRRRELLETASNVLIPAGGNVREIAKRLLYDLNFSRDDVMTMLPPTPHELRAEMENELINENKLPLIADGDDDAVHISIHMKAENTPAKETHILAHILNFIRKAGLQEVRVSKGRKMTRKEEEIATNENTRIKELLGQIMGAPQPLEPQQVQEMMGAFNRRSLVPTPPNTSAEIK